MKWHLGAYLFMRKDIVKIRPQKVHKFSPAKNNRKHIIKNYFFSPLYKGLALKKKIHPNEKQNLAIVH